MEHLSQEVRLTLFPKQQDDVPTPSPLPAQSPVVVLTDGNLSFPLAAAMDAAFALGGGKVALVVGVGYATDDPLKLVSLRTRDLTPPTPLSGIPHRPGRPPINLEDYGGSENFYRFLIEELRPTISVLIPSTTPTKPSTAIRGVACSPSTSSSTTRDRSATSSLRVRRSGGTRALCSTTSRALWERSGPKKPRPEC
jgi:enterochelin esterase-like enzyme